MYLSDYQNQSAVSSDVQELVVEVNKLLDSLQDKTIRGFKKKDFMLEHYAFSLWVLREQIRVQRSV